MDIHLSPATAALIASVGYISSSVIAWMEQHPDERRQYLSDDDWAVSIVLRAAVLSKPEMLPIIWAGIDQARANLTIELDSSGIHPRRVRLT